MDAKRALYWGALYALVWTLGAVVGGAVVVGGYLLGIDTALDMVARNDPLRAVLSTAAPGLAVAVVGLFLWRLVAAWGLFRTLVPAVRDTLSETYDNERVKSEILSVLDERLSDMQQDLQTVGRRSRDADADAAAGDFDFD